MCSIAARVATMLNALHLRTYPPVIATWPINSLAPDTCESATCLGTSSVVTQVGKSSSGKRRDANCNTRLLWPKREESARTPYIVPLSLCLCICVLSSSAFECLSVGLSACVSQNTRRLNFIKLLCMLLVAVARSSYDENAIRYVGLLPVFIRHNCDANLRTGQTQ